MLAVVPRGDKPGYRVPVRYGEHPLDAETLLWVDGELGAPNRPFTVVDWGQLGVRPLACEVRAGDTLEPPRANLGPRRTHDEASEQLAPQHVMAVGWDDLRRLVRVTTRDSFNRVRTYHYDPEETVDMARVRPRRPRVRALPPEVFEGPYTSRTNAVWVFQKRHPHGGRQPARAPRFDPSLPPLRDPETGDVIPYVCLRPGRRELEDADVTYTERHPSIFSPTARRMPEVRYILRAHGMLEDEEAKTGGG